MRLLLIWALVSLAGTLNAQFDNIIRPPTNQDRFIIQFDNCGWLDAPEGVDIRGYNLGFSAYVMREYGFGEDGTFPISFAWGYGISTHNIHSNGEFVTDSVTQLSELKPFPSNYSFEKNKLATSYLELPLEFRFRTGRKKRVAAWRAQADPEELVRPQFKFYLGAKVGYAINVHSKTRDDDGKRKIFGVDHLYPWRYGLTARIGFGAVTISGFYSLTPLIKEGRGTQVIPYSLGIGILLL